MAEKIGVVYLLHFEQPYEHAQHYLGFCESEEGLDSRFKYHESGRGSRLLAAVSSAGIKFTLARLWRGSRNDERRIKNGGHSRRYCPLCHDQPTTRTDLEELAICAIIKGENDG